MDMRLRTLIFGILVLCLTAILLAQSNEEDGPISRVPVDRSAPPPKDNRKAPPRSDQLAPDESSSKQTQIDVSPPSSDAKKSVTEGEVDEFHPWDPHRATKCVEVGDFYYKQGSYRAAISRYQEALEWKPRDAEATYKLGQALEKTGDFGGALENYQAYLKTLPSGPYAAKARQGIDRVKPKANTAAQAAPKPS